LLNLSESIRAALRYAAAVPCLCAVSAVALAQVQPNVPNAGSVLRELRAAPPAATAPLTAPELGLPRDDAGSSAASAVRIEVTRFEITGLSVTDTAAFETLLASYTGTGKSLADLAAAAKAVETKLRERGLFLAQVVIPVQHVVGGVVELQVFEGKLGDISVNVQPAARISRSLVERTLEPLQGNPLIERDRIDGALLRLGDLRGIDVRSTLKPGDEPGVADLSVDVDRGQRFAGRVSVDNGGSIYTGRDRYTATFGAFDLVGRGDVATLTAQGSSGMRNVEGSWLVPVNAAGTSIGPVAGWLSYELGTAQFAPLQVEGTARWAGLELQQTLLRSQHHNLYLQASVVSHRFADELKAFDLKEEKSIDALTSVGLFGQMRDNHGGLNNYSLTVASGELSIDDALDAALDAQTYDTAGRFTTVSIGLSRLQALTARDSILLATRAQLASHNLDSSQKLSLGGSDLVRGYPDDELPSDDAAAFSWEYRRVLNDSFHGLLTGSVFGDYGIGRQHDSPLPSDTDNTQYLQSHGVGLDYDKGALTVRSYVAWRGHTPAQSDDRGARVFVQASMSF